MSKYIYLKILIMVVLLLHIPLVAAAGSVSGTIKVKGLRSPANVLVFITKAPAVDLDFSKVKFIIDQKDLTFMPHILPVPVGATVFFPNHDKVDHNVFSLSRTQKFNFGSYKPGENKSIRFDKPGIVELRCDVHAEMMAYIMVMKNPFFGVSDAKGRFQIPDPDYLKQAGLTGIETIPAGKYTVKTWHEKLKSKKQTIEIPADGTVSIKLDLTRGTPSVLYKR
ncbi:MAG: plastocyanin/azurin family copper-binding protein [Desulfobacterales bacterium]